MKIHLCITFALMTMTVTGCRPHPSDSGTGTEPEVVGPQFSAKNGLLVPEETRRSLDVKIADVTEQTVPRTIELQMRVYEAGTASNLASAPIAPALAKLFTPGQPLEIVGQNGIESTAKVLRVDALLQGAAGTVELLAEIPHSTSPYPTVGGFLSARATLPVTENVVTIPRSALLRSSDGYSVYTVSGEHFVRTQVTPGAISEELVEIKDGLYTGDQVVIRPVMSLWMTELAAAKGGQACCIVTPKGK